MAVEDGSPRCRNCRAEIVYVRSRPGCWAWLHRDGDETYRFCRTGVE